MPMTRKQFLDIAGPGAVGVLACTTFGLSRRAEAARRRFAHNAGAFALGGAIRRPYDDVIETQASSVLTSVGGADSARVENFRYKERISFKVGSTQVLGSERLKEGKTVVETLALAEVEGLDVAGMVTADRVVARLTSSSTEDDYLQLPILPIGSYFQNLRVAGIRIDDLVQVHADLLKRENMKMERLQEMSATQFPDPDPPEAEEKTDSEDDRKRAQAKKEAMAKDCCRRLRFSIFGTMPERRIPGTTTYPGFRIDIPGFGTIYLGEFTAEPHSRQLNMIRLELGSPGEGSIVVCGVQGDGRDY